MRNPVQCVLTTAGAAALGQRVAGPYGTVGAVVGALISSGTDPNCNEAPGTYQSSWFSGPNGSLEQYTYVIAPDSSNNSFTLTVLNSDGSSTVITQSNNGQGSTQYNPRPDGSGHPNTTSLSQTAIDQAIYASTGMSPMQQTAANGGDVSGGGTTVGFVVIVGGVPREALV